jgi:peptide deformylase
MNRNWKQRLPEIIDTMPKTVWINPKYKGIESFGYREGNEACFSVKNVLGPVKRYQKIRYEAYTPDGKLVKGMASGYLARIIQHEIDHLDGILFSDKVAKDKLVTFEEYRRVQQEKLQQQKKAELSEANDQSSRHLKPESQQR